MDIPIHQAIAILSKIKQLGCTEVVLCPGGRNAPFVEVLSKLKTFNTTTLFEERSAGFYACGLIKKNNQPVAVITTSGTAVAELLPSVIEAYHQGLPLILITADRPKIFRGSGAPQAIEQANILSGFCQKSFDLEDDLSSLKNFTNLKSKPLHINICFDEPLLAGKKESYDQAIMERPQVPFAREEEIAFDIPVVSKPLVILGALTNDEVQFVLPLLQKMNCAIYAEAHSGLRLNTKLESKLIKTGANSVSLIFEQNKLDSVIRIGGIPTLRFWRDLEKLDCPVLNFSANSFSGLPRIKDEPYKINDLSIIAEQKFNNFSLGLIKEQTVIKGISRLMGKYPNSEQSFVFNLSKHIEAGGQIFLANSLPIREWDSFAKASEGIKVQTLRGANGIDGNISYFLGLTTDSQVNYCVLGDLSAMYDLSAGFLYKKYYRQKKIKIIVINNGGGKIFTSLFKNEAFENNHDIEFSGWAKMFGLDYQLVKDVSEINFTTNNEVMELVPDNNETFKFSEEYNLLIKGAL